MSAEISDTSLDVLRRRTEQIFGGRKIADVLPKQLDIVGPPRKQLSAIAQRAMDKLAQQISPTREELDALELCIRRMRPALLSHQGDILDTPQFSIPSNVRAALRAVLPGVAALTDAAGSVMGTGFLISANHVMTNQHVVDDLVIGRSLAEFRREQAEPFGHPQALVVDCVFQSSELDIAILAIEPDEPLPAPLPMSAQEVQSERPLLAIGYPVCDPSCPLLANEVFDGTYGVLRVSPGMAIGTASRVLFHDCSTLLGSSGSPLWDMTENAVIGVHRSGAFAFRNEAIPCAELALSTGVRGLAHRWI